MRGSASNMAAVGETINLLDPSNSSKNTLKLENVCTLSRFEVQFIDTMLDKESRHPDSDREEVPGEMEGRTRIRGRCAYPFRDAL